MIDKNVVTRIVDGWLEGKDYFLVDVTVTPDDKIVVLQKLITLWVKTV